MDETDPKFRELADARTAFMQKATDIIDLLLRKGGDDPVGMLDRAIERTRQRRLKGAAPPHDTAALSHDTAAADRSGAMDLAQRDSSPRNRAKAPARHRRASPTVRGRSGQRQQPASKRRGRTSGEPPAPPAKREPDAGSIEQVCEALRSRVRRRMLLVLLRYSPRSIVQLRQGTGVSKQAAAKHVAVLVRAGLVRTERVVRERLCHLDQRPLFAFYQNWLRQFVERRYDDGRTKSTFPLMFLQSKPRRRKRRKRS